eukprot:6168496-Amphidinium_carterae.1
MPLALAPFEMLRYACSPGHHLDPIVPYPQQVSIFCCISTRFSGYLFIRCGLVESLLRRAARTEYRGRSTSCRSAWRTCSCWHLQNPRPPRWKAELQDKPGIGAKQSPSAL